MCDMSVWRPKPVVYTGVYRHGRPVYTPYTLASSHAVRAPGSKEGPHTHPNPSPHAPSPSPHHTQGHLGAQAATDKKRGVILHMNDYVERRGKKGLYQRLAPYDFRHRGPCRFCGLYHSSAITCAQAGRPDGSGPGSGAVGACCPCVRLSVSGRRGAGSRERHHSAQEDPARSGEPWGIRIDSEMTCGG